MNGHAPSWRVCGRLGPGSDARVAAMSALLGHPRVHLDEAQGSLRADAAVAWAPASGSAVSLSPAPLPPTLPADAAAIAEQHDACSVVVPDDGPAWLHTGISGAAPLYADMSDSALGASAGAHGPVHICSQVDPLARTRSRPLRPDWDAWAHILGMGGPLEGRTTFEGIHRLPPWARLTSESATDPATGPATGPTVTSTGWPWLNIDGSGGGSLDAVREALAGEVRALAQRGPLAPLLSGGWDSRILTALAARSSAEPVAAWTTSSDTGTVLEELVAARVAERLGVEHAIVAPHRESFGADLEHFGAAVDYQTSFHVWLVPLAGALAGSGGTVLDGLGGGVFLGGAFPDDDSDRPVVDKRFHRMARYLDAAEKILHPNVAKQIRERTRASFERVAEPLTGHPYGNTFTAYLTRTLPGISLAPFGLLAQRGPIATPFLSDPVVRAALEIRPDEHADGGLYAPLLRPLAPQAAELGTAAEMTPAYRQHSRRVSSPEAAARLRELATREPVRGLLAPGLADAGLDGWRARLDRTRLQHLIRGVATLSLWLQRYEHLLDDASVDALREPVS